MAPSDEPRRLRMECLDYGESIGPLPRTRTSVCVDFDRRIHRYAGVARVNGGWIESLASPWSSSGDFRTEKPVTHRSPLQAAGEAVFLLHSLHQTVCPLPVPAIASARWVSFLKCPGRSAQSGSYECSMTSNSVHAHGGV